jgi:hypothetical protein
MPDIEKRLVNEGAEPAAKTPGELGKQIASQHSGEDRVHRRHSRQNSAIALHYSVAIFFALA